MGIKLSSPKIWLATEAVDFRKSIDGLCELIQRQFEWELKESIFIFLNRDRKKVKLLMWHKNGFVLIYKRMERGCFTLLRAESALIALDEKQLSWLLAGLDWEAMSNWQELAFDHWH